MEVVTEDQRSKRLQQTPATLPSGMYYWDPYKRTRPLRNVPPAGFLKISCVPVQHKRTPYRPSEKTQKIVPPS